MTPGHGRRGRRAAGAALLWCVAFVPPAAEAAAWRLDGGDVRILVGLRPGGSFEAKTTALRGTLTPGAEAPLALSGTVAVALSGIDTGISLRNRHLQEKLEVSRGKGFDEAVLSEIVLSAAESVEFRGQTPFSGTLLLHGVSREVTGQARIRPSGPGVRVEAEFVLTLTDFGVEPPAYMGVGVTNKVVVKVSFTAASTGGGGR